MIFLSLYWLLHVHSAVSQSCLITYARTAERTKGGRSSRLKRSLEIFNSLVHEKYDLTHPSFLKRDEGYFIIIQVMHLRRECS
jgi:hypothetical protein